MLQAIVPVAEEPHPFQLPQRLAHRPPGDAELERGGAEAAVTRDGEERLELRERSGSHEPEAKSSRTRLSSMG